MFKQKDLKSAARQNLKKHYGLFILLCLIASIIGTDFASSYSELSNKISEVTGSSDSETSEFNSRFLMNDALLDVFRNSDGNTQDLTSELMDEAQKQQEIKLGSHLSIGYSSGVLAGLVNRVSSGAFLLTLLSAMYKVFGSTTVTVRIFTFFSFIIIFLVWFFITNVFKIVYTRIFLEGRIYKDLPFQRTAFLISVRKWHKAAFTMFLTSVFHTLWMLTVIGGIIKHYSYFAVPYIVAENPDISAKKAITLSRRMMNGHKKECFLLSLSFLGWEILNAFTFGLSGIFFSNPYTEATYCEYYAKIRELAKENNIEDVDLLNDTYLYAYAPAESLAASYGTLIEPERSAPAPKRGFLERISSLTGIYFSPSGDCNFKERLKQRIAYAQQKSVLEHDTYPVRLSPIPAKEHRNPMEHLYYERRYSIWSLILMFFFLSVLGWVWEVSLHLIQDGNFVNRGVLFGPWLPIYGTGGILTIVLLNKLRRNPVAELIATVVLCGVVEYSIGWYLEFSHGGTKWWNYDGFFLNIDGRVCAEGLIVFGIGGMIIVYFMAPLLDNIFRKIPYKALIGICAVLLCLLMADKVYSAKHPNTGDGITTGYNYTIQDYYS